MTGDVTLSYLQLKRRVVGIISLPAEPDTGRTVSHLRAPTLTALLSSPWSRWQVALLFIVTAGDSVAHEPAWRSWFAAAEGLLPASVASPGSTRRHVPSLSRCARMLVRGAPEGAGSSTLGWDTGRGSHCDDLQQLACPPFQWQRSNVA